MIGLLINIYGFFLSLFIFFLLIIGLVFSKKQGFKEGFYFFLLMIIHQMYSFIAPWMFQNYFDSVMAGTASPLFGMTSGEMFQLFNNIPFTIECIAYFFLVIGIYRLWRNKMT